MASFDKEREMYKWKLKDYSKIRTVLNSSWAKRPISSLDIINAYGRQKIDTKTAEFLEGSIKLKESNSQQELKGLKRNNREEKIKRFLPNIK